MKIIKQDKVNEYPKLMITESGAIKREINTSAFWSLMPKWVNVIVCCKSSGCFVALSTNEENKSGSVAILAESISIEEFDDKHIWYVHQVIAKRPIESQSVNSLAHKVDVFINKHKEENEKKAYKTLEEAILLMIEKQITKSNIPYVKQEIADKFLKDNQLEDLVEIKSSYQTIKFIV